ncbi:MAG: hypothetical protein U0Q19_04105 [Kineosporiaceae bacterium]
MLRYLLAWLAAASALVWISSQVISSTVHPDGEARGAALRGGALVAADATQSTTLPPPPSTSPAASPSSPSPAQVTPTGTRPTTAPARTSAPTRPTTDPGGTITMETTVVAPGHTITRWSSSSSRRVTYTAVTRTTSSSISRVVRTLGGQVVLRIYPDRAELLSATPALGYSVRSWEQTGWLRVDFTSGNDTSTVLVTWNNSPPKIQVLEQ